MNATELLDQLRAESQLNLDEAGDMMIILDVWTSRILNVVLHPNDDRRSVTIVVRAAIYDIEDSAPFAGFVPTVHGDSLDGWHSVVERALEGAYIVSGAYITRLYQGAGFDQEKFLLETAADWDYDRKQVHMERRLEHASMRAAIVRRAALVMDSELDDVRRQVATSILEASWAALDAMGRALTAVDGQ
ncbi:MAG: hypothetical protein ACK53T_00160 [Planctomycetota bacterium]|jgi:hypothetical protein